MTSLKSAVWIPLFDELADPRVVASLAAAAEEAGWDALFVWDHVRWRSPVRAVADPWVALTAAAMVTERLRLGPMVTPLARRRPAVLARQTASLDVLSNGRLTLGVGIGADRFGEEFSRFGDEPDDRTRAAMTDESLDILRGAWTGEPVHHQGTHYTVNDVEFLPKPAQPDGIPIWIAGFPGNNRPRRRAARYNGFFPVNLTSPDELAEAVAAVQTFRTEALQADPPATPSDAPAAQFDPAATTAGSVVSYDVAVALEPDVDPAPYVAAGATWSLTEFDPHSVTQAEVAAVIAQGPFR